MASDTGFFLERRPRIDEAPPRPQRAWCLTVVRLECRLPPAENTLIRLSNTSVEVQLPLGVSLGFTARVEPAWGGQAQSGAAALWGRQTMAGMAPGGVASGNRLDGEVGYGLPVGGRLVGTPRVGIGASEHGRAYRLGYGLTVAQGGALHVELGVDAHRRRESEAGRRGTGVLGRAALRW